MGRQQVAERFEQYVDRSGSCHVWVGSLDKRGYGEFHLNGKTAKAHRVALQLTGVDTAEKSVLHTCDNPACVRTDHLVLGSQSDNVRDMWSKGRAGRGPFTLDGKLEMIRMSTAEAAAFFGRDLATAATLRSRYSRELA